MKYFLGEAANYSIGASFRQLFVRGGKKDSAKLRDFLAHHYAVDKEQVALTANGRSALTLAISALVPKKSQIIVNGFTCQAVVEAVKAAGCTPIYADINPSTLHFDSKTLAQTLQKHPSAKAIIIQNTLGLPLDAAEPKSHSSVPRLFSFARRQGLIIIEDLAHCAGRFYESGAECGSLGDAAILSFGKGKAIDTISGGALILRSAAAAQQPAKAPRLSDSLRARFYPLFGAIARGLTPTIFAKIWLGGLLKLHFIERSADAKLDITRRPAHWQAKLALAQMQKPSKKPLRDFALVADRPAALQALSQKGYYFAETWYDCPVSPKRNYAKWHFPEAECPVATEISAHIINLPTFYSPASLRPAYEIIKKYQIKEPKK